VVLTAILRQQQPDGLLQLVPLLGGEVAHQLIGSGDQHQLAIGQVAGDPLQGG
jgi:hypothetical protein